MFLFTVTKPGLRQTGALALCAACLCGTVAAAVRFAGQSLPASAAVQTVIEATQDIADYFTGRGFDTDLSSAAVDKVKIPRKWDDSFRAFNGVIAESGLSLEKYKGRKVEKWTLLCPALSGAEGQTYGVLLLYKEKPVGVYLLTQPGGEVTGVESARQTMAEAALQQGEEAAAAAPEEEAEIVSADIGDEEAEAAEAAALAETAGEWPVD